MSPAYVETLGRASYMGSRLKNLNHLVLKPEHSVLEQAPTTPGSDCSLGISREMDMSVGVGGLV